MPRTINPTFLAALQSGKGQPIVKAVTKYNGAIFSTLDVLKYELSPTSLKLTVKGSLPVATTPTNTTIALKRGVRLNGTDYTLTTSDFFPTKSSSLWSFALSGITASAECSLLPSYSPININGYQTYQQVITDFCTQINRSPVFLNPSSPWWSFKFFPLGKSILLNSSPRFLNLLRQKYFIFAADYGNNQILFFHGMDEDLSAHALTVDTVRMDHSLRKQIKFIAKDENQSLRTGGYPAGQLHNLGYLEAANAFPGYADQNSGATVTLPYPTLDILTGDKLDINDGNAYTNPAEVLETWKTNSTTWETIISQIDFFENTEGGALPSTVERISNYTPLNTSYFDNILSDSDNNVQAAFETLDEHTHPATPAPLQHAASQSAIVIDPNTNYLLIQPVFLADVSIPATSTLAFL